MILGCFEIKLARKRFFKKKKKKKKMILLAIKRFFKNNIYFPSQMAICFLRQSVRINGINTILMTLRLFDLLFFS